jgi:hypothetical protein
VATKADVGMGAVDVFNRTNGGIDVNVDDSRTASTGKPRIVLEGDVGLGLIEVAHERNDQGRGRHFGPPRPPVAPGAESDGGNFGCAGESARAGSWVGPVA